VRRLFSLAATAATILVLTSASPSLAAGEMRVGSTATGVPFTFLDTKSNSIQGFMVDLVTAVLDISRLEAGRLPVESKEVEIPALLEEFRRHCALA